MCTYYICWLTFYFTSMTLSLKIYFKSDVKHQRIYFGIRNRAQARTDFTFKSQQQNKIVPSAMQGPHDAQEPFEDLLASSCGHVDRGDSLCVDSVMGKIQAAVNRCDNHTEPSKKTFEDEQMAKLCIFFANVKTQTKADAPAENISPMHSSSDLVLPAPIRFCRKLRKAKQ
jgi:hypothetical protein